MRRRTGAQGSADTPHRPPASRPTGGPRAAADVSGRDVLGRLQAAVESIRHQLAARRRNPAGPGGPTGNPGGR
jgi:hypothetical protein